MEEIIWKAVTKAELDTSSLQDKCWTSMGKKDKRANTSTQICDIVIHGVAKSQTQLSDWTELNWTESYSQTYISKLHIYEFHST